MLTDPSKAGTNPISAATMLDLPLLGRPTTAKLGSSTAGSCGLPVLDKHLARVAQQPLAEKREAFSGLGERYKEALEKWETEKPAVAERAEVLKTSIEELRGQVHPNMLLRFDRIRERYGGRAMAEIRGLDRGRLPKIWHCAACNYRVRPHVVMQILNEGNVVLCDSCKRILYLERQEPEA